MTRQNVDKDVFPVNQIKSQIIEWRKKRFELVLSVADTYKNDKEKLNEILILA
jgi:hypothetical protein